MFTINQKIKILDQISKKLYTVLCEEYGIGRSTITDIKKREPALRAYKAQDDGDRSGMVSKGYEDREG